MSKFFKKTVSMILLFAMLVTMNVSFLGTQSSAYSEVSDAGNWYSWGAMQSCADYSTLDTIYGNPVSSEFVGGQYVVTVDNSPNEAYRQNMLKIADWALNAYATAPDGSELAGVYGRDFWKSYNNSNVYNGFYAPSGLNRTAATLNEIPTYYTGTSYAGNLYYSTWDSLYKLAISETTGNVASSLCQSTTVPSNASVSVKINTEGNCLGTGGQGKFSLGFIANDDYFDTVLNSNTSWFTNASCGLSAISRGLYVSFASITAREDSYDYLKVTYNGTKLTSSALDGWIQSPVVISAKGDVEYTLSLKKTGGSKNASENGLYSLILTANSTDYTLASNISMANDVALRYYISYSTPQYTVNSAPTASYTVTKVGKNSAEPENVQSYDHSWDIGVVTKEATCVSTGTKVFTCQDNDCDVTKTVTIPTSEGTHKYGDWSIVTTPVCGHRGVKSRTCSVCGKVEKANVDALEHNYSEWNILSQPTCTAPGYREKVCANCNDVISEYYEADGHKFGDWTVVTPASSDTDGLKVRICSVCGYEETLPIPATTFPKVTTFNYSIIVEDTEGLNFIRLAKGTLTTAKEIKNSASLISFDKATIKSLTENGIFEYSLTDAGTYSLWLRYDNGKEYIKTVSAEKMNPVVSVNGLMATVHNLYGVSDFFIAKGHYTTYRDIKENYTVQVTSAKFGASHNYTYSKALPGSGEYTLWIRYEDSNREPTCLYFPCFVKTPEFTVNGLQLSITGTGNARVVRIAPGTWSTPGEIKRAAGCVNYTASRVCASDTFTIQNAKTASGPYTVSIEYTNGYSEVFNFNVEQKVPTYKAEGTRFTISNLFGLQVLRYAKGEYTTASEIKNAPDSEYLRYGDIIGDEAELDLVGTYTFLVQYTDNSSAIFTVTIGEYANNVTVSKAFSNDMVVQRDKPLSVWGWAPVSEANKIVRVEFRGESTYGVVNSKGEWKATFDKTFSESTTQNIITVSGKNVKYNYTGVLTGDVYYVMGQSNIYWGMTHLVQDLTAAGKLNTIQYDYSDARNIRFFRNSNTYYVNDKGVNALGTSTVYDDVRANVKWMKPSNSDVQYFSAVGYLTAWNLSNCITTPIGMIEIDASGYELAAFAPNELCDKWDADIEDTATGIHYSKLGTGASTQIFPLQSRFAWNFQLNPLKNFSCAGILWYQGESDYINTICSQGKSRYTFTTEFAELMTYYRENFGNSDFPVYLMEFPAVFKYPQENQQYIDTGYVRSELGTIPMILENSYVIPSSDLWTAANASWWNNIHPYCKPAQALRACYMFLAKNYGILDVDTTFGPTLKSIEYTDAYTAVLTFNYVGDGLTYNDINKNGLLYGFEVLTGTSSRFSGWSATGKATITAPNQITVKETIPIYGVRYNAQTSCYYPNACNVSNSAGVPMVAFADYKF